MDTIAVVSSLVAVAVGVAAWRQRIPDQLSHAAMTLLVTVTTADATAHLLITADPQETVGFMFLLVGIGVVLLRRAWLVPSAIGIWACWAFVVGYLGGSSVVWGHWTFYMLTASGLGAVVVLLRRRSIDVANSALRQAMRAATEDTATTLSNRRGLEMRSRELVAIARRRGEIVHCTFLDVDGLKAINDERGHDAGDRVILAVAQALSANSRATDVIARWGGDEFVLVGMGAGIPPAELERRLRAWLIEHFPSDATLTSLQVSVGHALLEPWDEGDVERLLWVADRDMYVRRAIRGGHPSSIVTVDGGLDTDL
jgi:diguanylate cyclase (GGDEF)-like protein